MGHAAGFIRRSIVMTQPVGIPILTDLEEGKPDVTFVHDRYVVTVWDEPNQAGSQMGSELGRFARRQDAEECVKNPPKDKWYSNDPSESIYGYISEALNDRIANLANNLESKFVDGKWVKCSREEYRANLVELEREVMWAVHRLYMHTDPFVEDFMDYCELESLEPVDEDDVN